MNLLHPNFHNDDAQLLLLFQATMLLSHVHLPPYLPSQSSSLNPHLNFSHTLESKSGAEWRIREKKVI